MNKQSAFNSEEYYEKIVKEVEERRELKRKRKCEIQRAYRQRQKALKKSKKKVPKTNAERQREFRQRKAEKLRRRKLCSNEENVVQAAAASADQQGVQMTMKVVQANEHQLLESCPETTKPPKAKRKKRNEQVLQNPVPMDVLKPEHSYFLPIKEEFPWKSYESFSDQNEIQPKIPLLCPNCYTILPETFQSTHSRHEQVRSVIAKVYHFLEQEYSELKSLYPHVDLSPLSSFSRRAAAATGVTEPDVLDILREEADRLAAADQPPAKQTRTEESPLIDSNEERVIIKKEQEDDNITHYTDPLMTEIKQEDIEEEGIS